MNILLWSLQAILGIKLFTTAVSHGPLQGKTDMQLAMGKLGSSAQPVHGLVSLCLLLATAGLLLPGLLGWPGWVTPASAAAAGLFLLVSILFHVRTREKPKVFVSLVLFAFAVFVAYGRGFLQPFGD
jgi:hypothetical protein